MADAEIIVDCSPDGKVKIEVNGMSGPACTNATAQLEKALGLKGTRTKKPEFNKRVGNTQKNTANQGQ